MDYTEAKLRIIRKLPDDFLSDDKNREALLMFENLFTAAELEESKQFNQKLDKAMNIMYEASKDNKPEKQEIIDKINKGELPPLTKIENWNGEVFGLQNLK